MHNSLLFVCVIALLHETVAIHDSSSRKNRILMNIPDMLCNIGDEHECVCNRSLGDLDGKYLPCDNFLESKRLSVIYIKMRYVNLNARLYTNESYQQYFRRRIANIISRFCENQPDECSESNYSSLRKNQQELQSAERNHNKIKNAQLIEEEDQEPQFSLENVVILKVIFDERNQTEVHFVVTKTLNIGSLNNAVIVDPVKIKYILSAQIAPLSRVLGGIRIVDVKLSEIEKPHEPYDNKKLITILLIALIVFFGSCTIAFIKLIRELIAKNRSTNRKLSTTSQEKSSKNYGSCTDKFLPVYDLQNGKSKSLNNSTRSKKRKSTTCSLKASYLIIETEENEVMKETDAIKQRSIKNLFKCDPSQLPRESCDFYNNNDYIRTNNITAASNFEEDDPFSTINSASSSAQTQNGNNFKFNPATNLPSVILISSQSDAYIVETNNNDMKPTKDHSLATKSNGNLIAPIDIERPLSRRGSRESTPEQGAEEGRSSREDTPLPLGDELASIEQKKKLKSSKKAKTYSNNNSSSSESDEELKVYHPLQHYASDSDEDEMKCETENHYKNNNNNNLLVNKYDVFRPYSANSMLSSEEDTNDEDKESRILDRHNYKRLQESPIPPSLNEEYKTINNR